MAPPAVKTTVDLLASIRKSRALPDATADATLASLTDLPPDPVHAANQLIKNGVLTPFQAKMLLAGKTRGFRLGDYLIQEQIGQGGMGAVYLATHQTLQRRVAVKVLPPSTLVDQLAIERFLREARTAAALDHPNIVRLFDIGKQGEVRYLILEYVQGETLDKLIAKGPLALGRAVAYVAQAAAGLQHAHEKGFIHRDIKPGNLILAKDGTLKILDMGLARSSKQHTSITQILDDGAVVGTADYISPEQALNESSIDIRADIYSLGATFYALVTGRPPFNGTTASKLINHQLKDPPSLSSLDKTFPHELALVVSKMMAKKPDARYQTPAEVVMALEPWLNDSPAVTAAISKTEAAERGELSTSRLRGATKPMEGRKLDPKWLALGGGVALLIVAGVAWAIWPSQEPVPVAKVNSGVQQPAPKPNETVEANPVEAKPIEAKPIEAKPIEAKPIETKPIEKKWIEGETLYTLDLSQQKPFERVIGAVESPNDPTKTQEKVKVQKGAGDLPLHWSVTTWSKGHETRGFAESTADGAILGLQAMSGNAMMFLTLPTKLASPAIKVRMEYQSTCAPEKLTLRLRQMGVTATVSKTIPAAVQWSTVELIFDSAKVTAPRLEFHNQDAATGAVLKIRKLDVIAVSE